MTIAMSKKHVSRKLKSAWRKHIDISDVEQFLEEQRQDERTGDRTGKPDAELFQVEKQPLRAKATLREIRRQKYEALPRSLQPLVNTSNVPDPIAKRNVRKNRNPLPPVAPPPVRVRKQPRPCSIGKPTAEDIWAQDPVPEALNSEWIGKDLVHHTMRNTGKPLVVNLPERMDDKERFVPTKLKLPHAGSSYNPAIDDYLALKDKVVRREKYVIQKEEFLDRNVTKKFVKMTPEEKYYTSLQEMTEGLLKNEEDEDEDEQASEGTVKTEKIVPSAKKKGAAAKKGSVAKKGSTAKNTSKAKPAAKTKKASKPKNAPAAKPAAEVKPAPKAPAVTAAQDEQATPVVKIAKRKKPVTKTKLRQRVQKYVEEKQVQRELGKLLEIERVDEINRELDERERKLKQVMKGRVNKKRGLRCKTELPFDFVEPTQLSGSLRTLQPLNNLLATGVLKARKISIMKKTRAEVMRKEKPIKKTRYTRKSHKEPLSEPLH